MAIESKELLQQLQRFETRSFQPRLGSIAQAAFGFMQQNELEKQAYDYFRKIDALGGMVKAIEHGFPQREIADAAYRYQREIDEGARKIVGVNAYQENKPLSIPILEMDAVGYQRQVRRLADLRKSRDAVRQS